MTKMIPAMNGGKPQVMLIDDCSIDNYVNDKMLRFYGFSDNTIVFSSGTKALKHINAIGLDESRWREMPEYIFLDLNMPVMSGHTFMEEFQKMDERLTARTKVVVLSSSIDPLDRLSVLGIPSVIAFLGKPLIKSNLDELTAIIGGYAKAG